MKNLKINLTAVVIFIGLLLFAGCSKEEKESSNENNTKNERTAVTVDTNTYYASNDLEFWADYPGKSPSGAEMVKVTDPAQIEKIKKTIEGSAKGDVYTCEMHPQVRQNYNGNCPICKMDLIKLEKPEHKEDMPGKK
jgi:PBP1b-binding outer membrane lipoprotein LpoB